MLRYLQKLNHRGNSCAVNIPRGVLHHTGWRAGEWLVLELLDDRSVRVRAPRAEDFQRQAPPPPAPTQPRLPELT